MRHSPISRHVPYRTLRKTWAVWLVIVLGAAAGAAAAEPAPPAPQEVPAYFTSTAADLTIHFFAGLFRCPMPSAPMAKDTGLTVYLATPSTCDPDADAPLTPHVTVSYAPNDGQIQHADAAPGPPRSNAELPCVPPAASVPTDLSLFGAPGVGCAVWVDDHLSYSIGALFNQRPPGQGTSGPPDHVLWVTLDTARLRFPRDLRVFRTILWAIQQCTPADRPADAARPRCPENGDW